MEIVRNSKLQCSSRFTDQVKSLYCFMVSKKGDKMTIFCFQKKKKNTEIASLTAVCYRNVLAGVCCNLFLESFLNFFSGKHSKLHQTDHAIPRKHNIYVIYLKGSLYRETDCIPQTSSCSILKTSFISLYNFHYFWHSRKIMLIDILSVN